jgi:nicotinate phosphoribosyltransferase
MEEGKRLVSLSVQEAAAYAKERLTKLSPERKRFENPHIYKVGMSQKLMETRNQLIQKYQEPK